MKVVKEICNRMAIMQNGKIIEEGNVYEVFATPKTDLTQEFIKSVVSYEIPINILNKCQGPIIKVIFKGQVAGESIISDTLQLFKVKGNFLHGSIEYIQELPLGIFIMEIDGKQPEINNAIKYIENRFAQVEVLRDGL